MNEKLYKIAVYMMLLYGTTTAQNDQGSCDTIDWEKLEADDYTVVQKKVGTQIEPAVLEDPDDPSIIPKKEKQTIYFGEEPDCEGRGDLHQVPQDVVDWKFNNDPFNEETNDNDYCYVTQEKKAEALPSLRYCYSTTQQACCNFIEDQTIGDRYNSFAPGPCSGDFSEIFLYSCLGCLGTTNNYVIKAEANEKYVTVVNELFKFQRKLTGIYRDPFQKNDKGELKYPKGYIKVCSHWLARFWTGDNKPLKEMSLQNQDPKILNGPTKIFDSCGVYDFNDGGNGVPRGSKKEEWQDALSFLEWYGLPQMDGFGVIIIDTMAEKWIDQYVGLRVAMWEKSWIRKDEDFQDRILGCFDQAKQILVAATILATSLLVSNI